MFVIPEVFHNLNSHLDEENRLTWGWVNCLHTGCDEIACLLFCCSVTFVPFFGL